MQTTSRLSATSKPTLAQVRALAQQLTPASRRKLLSALYAAEVADEVREIAAISQAVAADVQARGLSAITDADLERELGADRQARTAPNAR